MIWEDKSSLINTLLGVCLLLCFTHIQEEILRSACVNTYTFTFTFQVSNEEDVVVAVVSCLAMTTKEKSTLCLGLMVVLRSGREMDEL